MQHYSAPTRFLDWTTSFNVALYFAITDEPRDCPGAVWSIWANSLYECMKGYKDPSETELEKIFGSENEFVAFGTHKAEPKVDTYDMTVKSERMIAQQTIFTYCHQLFCDHADLIGNTLLNYYKQSSSAEQLLWKIVISPDTKKKIKEYLHKLNITAATLFPGVDGIGKAISEIIDLQYDVFYSSSS